MNNHPQGGALNDDDLHDISRAIRNIDNSRGSRTLSETALQTGFSYSGYSVGLPNPDGTKKTSRVYVNLSDGTQVGHLDLHTFTPHPKPGMGDVLAAALTAFAQRLMPGAEPPTTAGRSTARPPERLRPWTDLAGNRPGGMVVDAFGTDSPAARAGLIGEQRTAGALAPTLAHGWRVLHSVPLGQHKDIDHLLIGPGGTIAVNTKATSYRATVTGEHSSVDGRPNDWWESINRDALVISRTLSAVLRQDVPVSGRVCVWADLGVDGESQWLIPGEAFSEHLVGLPTVMDQVDVDTVFAAARRSDTW